MPHRYVGFACQGPLGTLPLVGLLSCSAAPAEERVGGAPVGGAPAGGLGGSGGAGAASGGANGVTGGDDEGGCDCRAAGPGTSPWRTGYLLAAIAWALAWSRRLRPRRCP